VCVASGKIIAPEQPQERSTPCWKKRSGDLSAARCVTHSFLWPQTWVQSHTVCTKLLVCRWCTICIASGKVDISMIWKSPSIHFCFMYSLFKQQGWVHNRWSLFYCQLSEQRRVGMRACFSRAGGLMLQRMITKIRANNVHLYCTQAVITPRAWIKETETLLSDREEFTHDTRQNCIRPPD